MANTILVSHETMDLGVTITGGTPASASFALANVATVQPSESARFSNALAANTYFVIRTELFATGDNAISVFVGYANVSESCTIRLRAADSESYLTSAPIYDSGAVNFWTVSLFGRDRHHPRGGHHHFYISPADATAAMQWWRIDIDDEAGTLDGYVEVGVINIGESFTSTNPISNGWSFGAVANWVGQTSMGGQRYRRGVSATNVLEATWQVTSQSQAFLLHNLIRNNAESKAMLCIIDTDDEAALMNNTAWGHMTATQPIAVPYFGLWQTTLRVEEMP